MMNLHATTTDPQTLASPSAHANPDAALIAELDGVPFRPVFIMGDHRSGTTLLYQLLAQTGCFGVVTAYHVLRYGAVLENHRRGVEDRAKRALSDEFEAKGLFDRRLDGVRVTPDLPEEYGFVLGGGTSGKALVTPETLPKLVELCRKVRVTSGGDRPVLLKNPWDYANFAFVKRALPDARFVFLHRHPARVIDSQIRAVRSLFAERNGYVEMLAGWYRRALGSPLRLALARSLFASPVGFRVAFRHVRRANAYYLEHAPALPEADAVCLRYEDLCADPEAAIGRVASALDLELPPGLDFKSQIRTREGALLPEVERARAKVARALDPYYRRWGYATNP